jgi:hypothetical protein
MRSTKNKDVFFSKMKKKPEVTKIINNMDSYTAEQLGELRSTHFPLWIREELIKLKNRNGKSSENIAFDIAMQMIAKTQK